MKEKQPEVKSDFVDMSASAGDMIKTHEGEHHGDFGDVPIKLTRSAMIFALCAAVNSCNLGYDVGSSTAAGIFIQEELELTRVQREVWTGSLNFWAIFGALGAQVITDKMGRRKTFVVSAFIFVLGILITIATDNFAVIMLGRFFIGIGLGIGLAVDPLYIAEVTPAKYRGNLVSWSEIGINVGLVFGFASNLIFAGLEDNAQWRVMILMGAFMPCVMVYCAFYVMPESPRWLAQHGRTDEAREVLLKIYPEGFNVEPILEDIQESIERDEKAEHASGWAIIFHPSPAFQRMLMVGISTAIAQQAVGIDAIQYYLLDVIEDSGIDDNTREGMILIFLGIVKLCFVFVGAKLFDKQGRRRLLFISLIGMIIALILTAFALMVETKISTAVTVIGLSLYLAFFSTGMGPGCWLVPSEVFSVSIRAKAMSVASMMNRITATLMASTFLSTADAIGGFGPFCILIAVVCAVVLAFFYKFLPETKGRSLEDMSAYFAEITGDRSVLKAEMELVKNRPQKDLAAESPAEPSTSTEAEVI